MIPVQVSRTALEAYQEFYPEAGDADVLEALKKGVVAQHGVALRLVGRRSPHQRHRGSYVMHAERTGIFVLSDVQNEMIVVITFLRFLSYRQYLMACRLYPGGAGPTAAAPWFAPAIALPEK